MSRKKNQKKQKENLKFKKVLKEEKEEKNLTSKKSFSSNFILNIFLLTPFSPLMDHANEYKI